jgi:C1A family cysteine protease
MSLTSFSSTSYASRFAAWVREYRVSFLDEHEYAHRLSVWIQNDKLIAAHNAQGNATSFELGHNQFSMWTRAEFAALFLSPMEAVEVDFSKRDVDSSDVPASVDWVAAGAVTGVKDQGQCGSCWSFSTTGALEGAYFVKYGSQVSFSEQELVDCDGFDAGCNGGLMDRAFRWIKLNGGLCTESSYPYVSGSTQKAGSCAKSACSSVSGSAVASWVDVAPDSQSAMQSAVALQPVSVAIEADQTAFQLYKSGVFTGTCGSNLDHGVLLVGYGTDAASGYNYWKVKNSWGTSWGEAGYIRMQRGKAQTCDQCGILCQGSYPLL